MTPTDILKEKLSDMDIELPAFEDGLDIKTGTLLKEHWTDDTIEYVYSELHAVFGVRIKAIEQYLGLD